MSLVGIFKSLFGPMKPKEEVKPEIAVAPENVPINQPIQAREVFKEKCEKCLQPLFVGEGYTKQAGQYYHRKCWKEVVKSVW